MTQEIPGNAAKPERQTTAPPPPVPAGPASHVCRPPMTMYEGLGKTWACPECGEVFVSAISGSTIYLRHAEAPQPTPSYSILEAPQWRIPNMTREKALEQATILGTIFVGRAGINGLSPDEAVEATLIIADKMVAWLEEPTGQAVSTAGP